MHKLYRNEYLFSEIYLDEITNFPEKSEITTSLRTLKEYKEYADTESINAWKSTFIQKVFGVLGFGYNSVNDNLLELFAPGENEKPISLCYTLLPTENLENATIGRHWSEKIIRSLRKYNLKWGLLTNGNEWRIYHTDEPTPYESYLEVDLVRILEEENTKSYTIFYEFLKVYNFIQDEKAKCKFDEFKKESFEQIEYIEDELKRALKQQEGEGGKGVLNDLCMGYVDYLRSKETKDFSKQNLRDQIYSGAMLYMFRLLFVFYASARNLLTDDEIKSFYKILNECVVLFHSNKGSKQSFVLWEKLREVFGIIDVHYNGGLFDPEENKFIDTTRVSDYFLCRVLYNMNFYQDENGNEKPISFRDMGVRHLGTLYEGLLEHKLFVAEENTQVKIEKGIVKFIAESEGGVIIEGGYVKKGVVYFAGDKGERKSTGSFYTPEYIVDYIVNNTICQKLKELKEEFDRESAQLLQNIQVAPEESERNALIADFRDKQLNFVNRKVLKLSVLDPAMGSGHFLVNSTNKISNFITEFLNENNFIFNDNSSTTYWRRRVVENCIYGVDINPLAVELAKLSLWILSMAKDAHLSFLNHHLKCGNSLIGARLSTIGIYPGNNKSVRNAQISIWDENVKFKETVGKVLNDYLAIERRETVSKDDIEFKKELLDEITEALKPYKIVCDFHTSIYFDNEVDESEYFTKVKNPETIKEGSYNYFHWELEFPEIFWTYNGFDCVVGNPPWGQKSITFNYNESHYLNIYYPSSSIGQLDIFRFFLEGVLNLLVEKGIFSYVLPDIILLKNYESSRRLLLDQTTIKEIIHWGMAFKNVNLDTCSIIATKGITPINTVLAIIHKENNIIINKITQQVFAELDGCKFNLYIDNSKLKIIDKLEQNSRFEDYFEVHEGIHSGNIRDKLFLSEKENDYCKKLIINSKGVVRYNLPVPTHWVNYRKEIIEKENGDYAGLGRKEYFETNKIVIRRTGDFILANIDYNKTYFSNNFFVCRPLDSNTIPMEYFLGILNSTLMTWYYNTIQPRKGKLFAELKINQLKKFPIKIDILNHNIIASLVIEVMEKMKQEANKKEINILLNRIDELVFQLYSLNQEEINIITSNNTGE